MDINIPLGLDFLVWLKKLGQICSGDASSGKKENRQINGRYKGIVWLLCLDFLLSAPGFSREERADYCREVVADGASSGPASYRPRANGRYCDGILFQPHSGSGELPIIGVMATPIKGDPGTQSVSISAFVPPVDTLKVIWPLHLQGIALSPTTSYRLDAALTSGAQSLTIGAESGMIRMTPRQLRAEDVSWSAWGESSQYGRIYFPVMVTGGVGRSVAITVRPTLNTAYIVYKMVSLSGGILKPEQDVADNPKIGEPVTIVIPAGEPREVVVNVVVVGNDGDTQVARITLVRPGREGK